MNPSRRWFQYSLRSFLILMTALAVWLGWKVEKARRRGKAIDAIVEAGGVVTYADTMSYAPEYRFRQDTNHFFSDLAGTPLSILLDMHVNATTVSRLSAIYGIDRLDLVAELTDDDLKHLKGLDGVDIVISHADNVSQRAMKGFYLSVPNSSITHSPALQHLNP